MNDNGDDNKINVEHTSHTEIRKIHDFELPVWMICIISCFIVFLVMFATVAILDSLIELEKVRQVHGADAVDGIISGFLSSFCVFILMIVGFAWFMCGTSVKKE